MDNLKKLYQSAKGLTFTGEVVRHQQMREKEWTVIEITNDDEAFKEILGEIYRMVGEGQIWRGFTGPPDYHNYWLWVDLNLPVGVAGRFTVTGYNGPFRLSEGEYQAQKGYCFMLEEN